MLSQHRSRAPPARSSRPAPKVRGKSGKSGKCGKRPVVQSPSLTPAGCGHEAAGPGAEPPGARAFLLGRSLVLIV